MPKAIKKGGEGRDFTEHPAGMYTAVLCDALDLGYKMYGYGERYRGATVFYCGCDERDEEGNVYPLTVAEFFNVPDTLSPKSSLVQHLEQWGVLDKIRYDAFGNPAQWPELVEDLIGTGATINVVHREHNGKTYANIASIMPAADIAALPEVPESFVRLKDRPDWEGPAPSAEGKQELPEKLPWED